MKLLTTILVASVFVLCTAFVEGYTWTQAWVDKRILSKNELPKPVFDEVKKSELIVVLRSKKELIVSHIGNRFLRCYLINNSDTAVVVPRSDATIAGFFKEIYKNGAWVKFQKPLDSNCGNSAWKQKLNSRQVLSIDLDHDEDGPIEVPFRIRYDYFGRTIYSNIIMVDIDEKNYDRVGD